MNRMLILSAIIPALLLAANPAFAEDRLQTRGYDENEIVRIPGRVGVQTTVTFAEDEHIENVAVGDSGSWQVTPNKRANILFVKPLTANARTNMTVVTDRHQYFFDLVASTTTTPVYRLSFTYPDEPEAIEAQQAVKAALTDDEQQLMVDGAVRPVDPAELNFAWHKSGDRKILPAQVYDDGFATYVTWSPKAELPAILIRNEKGEEGPVNFAVRNDLIVIEGVPELIVLRAGKTNATLENLGEPRRAATSKPSTELAAADGRTAKEQ